MEQLQITLEAVYCKRVSDDVWAAADAAHYVLNAFRDQVNKGVLAMSAGVEPYFTFDPYCLSVPAAGASFAVSDWEKHSEYVLGIIRASTDLGVNWPGPGNPITLERRLPWKPGFADRKGLGCIPELPAKMRAASLYPVACGVSPMRAVSIARPATGLRECPVSIAPCPGPTVEFDKCPLVTAVFKGRGPRSSIKPPCSSSPDTSYEDEPYTGNGAAPDIEILEPEKKQESP